MKIKIIIILILGFATSCKTENSHKMKVYMSNGDGWDMSSTEMSCDSVTMVNKNNAIVYINGYKSTIYADVILLNTNR
jgi:hypothetical protein